MIKIEIDSTKAENTQMADVFEGDCQHEFTEREVCTGTYIQRLNDNIKLCEALRAVYAIAGEDKQVRQIVNEALDKYAAG